MEYAFCVGKKERNSKRGRLKTENFLFYNPDNPDVDGGCWVVRL